MKRVEQEKPKMSIILPNLLLIPLLSVIGSLLKFTLGSTFDWIWVSLIIPFGIYIVWTIVVLVIGIVIYNNKFH